MSAFMVSLKTMQRCVTAMLGMDEDPQTLGDQLYAMNARAVGARYGETVAWDPYQHATILPDRFRALKALECLLYQCTEGDVPDEPLYRRLRETIYAKMGEIVRSMPQWEAAGWDS